MLPSSSTINDQVQQVLGMEYTNGALLRTHLQNILIAVLYREMLSFQLDLRVQELEKFLDDLGLGHLSFVDLVRGM